MTTKPARILIIAGSDSSGGAGIQADIKTASALGCYAMTAITAVTAQNTTGVQYIHRLSPDIVREQVVSCLSDIGADAIKVGMLGDAAIVEAVAVTLSQWAGGIPIVLDPVMVAKGGAPLADVAAVEALKARLLPLAALVTPNIPEAERLAGASSGLHGDIPSLGRRLLAAGSKAVLVKGGHGAGNVVEDWLFQADNRKSMFSSARLDTPHTHGTGCTLSTAITCGLGQGLTMIDAVKRAHDYVHEAIRAAPGFGSGHGPLNHMHGKVR